MAELVDREFFFVRLEAIKFTNMENNQTEICCTPEGQIKRYQNCVGCDRKPEKIIYIENKYASAAQWLIRQQKHNKYFDIETIEKAIEMEKEQCHYYYNQGVKDDYFIGHDEFIKYHYNETYEK